MSARVRVGGVFAFVLMLIARDPLGEKFVYWAVIDGRMVCASELKTILEMPDFKKEIDPEAVAKYFLYGYVPAPQTIFKGVRKLLPGYWMQVSGEGELIEQAQFWDLDFSNQLNGVSPGEIKRRAVQLLSEVVSARIPEGNAPFGILLSGGVDSSLVAALAGKLADPQRIRAFSVGFGKHSVDESSYAVQVAKYLGIKHRLETLSSGGALGLIPQVTELLAEPMADPSILPTLFVSQFAREEVEVALSGDGGDEVMAGYPKHLAHWFLEQTRLGHLPLELLASILPGKLGVFAKYASYPLYQRNQLWVSQFSPQQVCRLTGYEGYLLDDLDRYHWSFKGQALDEGLYIDIKLNLADLYLVKTERACAGSSLEVRCPFLDKAVVEMGASIPLRTKMHGFRTKQLLKEIADQYLPANIIFRPKQGFGIPLREWLSGELRPLLVRELAPSKLASEGILDVDWLRRYIRSGQATPSQLWTLLVFELWYRRWGG